MAFEGLSQKLQGALKKMTGRGKLNEQAVREGMREVRMALLEADVNYAVAKDFIKKVTEFEGNLVDLRPDDLHALRPAGRRQDDDVCQARRISDEAGKKAHARRLRHLSPGRHQAAPGGRRAGSCSRL